MFEIKNGTGQAGEVFPLTCQPLVGSIANNTSIISARSTYRSRILAWEAQNVGIANATLVFKSGSGGSAISQVYTLASLDIIDKPLNYAGWFETGSNTALVCDITGELVNLTVWYVQYQP